MSEPLMLDLQYYFEIMQTAHMRLPERAAPDAGQSWLTPVPSISRKEPELPKLFPDRRYFRTIPVTLNDYGCKHVRTCRPQVRAS